MKNNRRTVIIILGVILIGIGCRHGGAPRRIKQSKSTGAPAAETTAAAETGAAKAYAKKEAKPSPPSGLPESAEDNLSAEEKVALEAVRKEALTVALPFKFEDSLGDRAVYSNWFFRGYTFTKVTGVTHQPHSLYRHATAERRPVIEGWMNGQARAAVDKLLEPRGER